MNEAGYTIEAWGSFDYVNPLTVMNEPQYNQARDIAERLLLDDHRVEAVIVWQEVKTLFGIRRREVFRTRVPW